ncbi:hypothetical protein Tco_0927256 [Tanacetum coccineum]
MGTGDSVLQKRQHVGNVSACKDVFSLGVASDIMQYDICAQKRPRVQKDAHSNSNITHNRVQEGTGSSSPVSSDDLGQPASKESIRTLSGVRAAMVTNMYDCISAIRTVTMDIND